MVLAAMHEPSTTISASRFPQVLSGCQSKPDPMNAWPTQGHRLRRATLRLATCPAVLVAGLLKLITPA